MNKNKILRKKLDDYKNNPILAPGVHDPYCARIAEKLGFDTLYMSGAATSMSRLGYADFGLITATEIQTHARYIASITKLPLIADSDTGYGNALNVMRTIQNYISLGISGVHIEDQIWPKRCGHLKGKLVIPKDEMVGKIKAAKKIINEFDPNFILIARTDSRGVSGGNIDKAIDRLIDYHIAGADVIFADGLTSINELQKIHKSIDAPILFHPTGLSPRLTLNDCANLGVGILLYPFASIHAMAVAVWNYFSELKNIDTRAQINFEKQFDNHVLKDIKSLFDLGGLNELQDMEEQFIPKEQFDMRYKKSIGL